MLNEYHMRKLSYILQHDKMLREVLHRRSGEFVTLREQIHSEYFLNKPSYILQYKHCSKEIFLANRLPSVLDIILENIFS
jgi:hypothetical protein